VLIISDFCENLKLPWIIYGRSEENWFQIQNMLKNLKNFSIGIKHHGIKQSYCTILKLENQQTMVMDPKSKLQ